MSSPAASSSALTRIDVNALMTFSNRYDPKNEKAATTTDDRNACDPTPLSHQQWPAGCPIVAGQRMHVKLFFGLMSMLGVDEQVRVEHLAEARTATAAKKIASADKIRDTRVSVLQRRCSLKDIALAALNTTLVR